MNYNVLMSTLRLVNLNVGIRVANTEFVVDFLKQQNADFVAIQEMVRHLEESVLPEYRVRDGVKAGLGMLYPYTFFAPVWLSDAFRNAEGVSRDFGGHIEQGNELLSKYPIIKGSNEFFYKSFEYIHDWSNWQQEDHGRPVQITEFDINGTPLQILNLHGVWTADKRGDERTLRECEYVVAAAKRRHIPTIITGDFNLLPDTPSIRLINDAFRNLIKEYNIQATRPEFKDALENGGMVVDYIFVNDMIRVERFEVVNSDVSDHFPLVLDFSLQP